MLAVSQLITSAKSAVERALPLCWVKGEISGFKRAASGHAYFALKDEFAQAPCVLYRHKSARVPVQLRDGMAVEVRVLATMYAPRGEFQLQVEEVRLAGVGGLYEAFARLKAALAAEGLFDAARKRSLPRFPRTVGLITSPTGAVLHDMVRTLRSRWPAVQVVLYPTVVQGAAAPAALLDALDTANARAECDVLVIGRGGGSMEDLWAFNDEALVRAIAASAIPIVSAVGHETDFTLADFAADARAATPTFAATLVVPDVREWAQRLDAAGGGLAQTLRYQLRGRRDQLATLSARLKHPGERLAFRRQHAVQLAGRLRRVGATLASGDETQRLGERLRLAQFDVENAQTYLRRRFVALQTAVLARFERQNRRVSACERALSHLAPLQVLRRGFAYVQTQNGAVVDSVARVQLGDGIRLTLSDGEVLSTVEHIVRKTD